MTRWPTMFDSHVWPTPSTPVAIAMKTIPPTSQASSVVSRLGIASSSTSRSRNGETIPSSADSAMSPSTEPEPHLVGAKEGGDAAGLRAHDVPLKSRWLRVQLQVGSWPRWSPGSYGPVAGHRCRRESTCDFIHARAARTVIAAGAVLAGLALAGVTPAAAEPLAQKAGAAGCIGEAPCTVGVETFMVAVRSGQPRRAPRLCGGVLPRSGDGVRPRSRTGRCARGAAPRAASPRAPPSASGLLRSGRPRSRAPSRCAQPGRPQRLRRIPGELAVAVFDRAANGTLTQKAGSAGCIVRDGAAPCADGTGLNGVRSSRPSARTAPASTSPPPKRRARSTRVRPRRQRRLTQKAGLGRLRLGDRERPLRRRPCAHGRRRPRGERGRRQRLRRLHRRRGGVRPSRQRHPRPAGRCRRLRLGDARRLRVRQGHEHARRGHREPGRLLRLRHGNRESAVAVFDRSAGGALTQKPAAAGCISSASSDAGCAAGRGLAETVGVSVSPDGASVYVLSQSTISDYGVLFDGPGSIANFDRSADGALTQPPGADGCVSDAGAADTCSDATRAVRAPRSLAISPDGRSAYLGAAGGLAIFDRGEPLPALPPPPPPPSDVTGPLLRGLAVAPARFRASTRGPSVATRGGTKISFRVDEAAALRFTVQLVVTGRRAGARCVPLRASNRSAKRCDRYRLLAGSFGSLALPGANSLRFSGRLAQPAASGRALPLARRRTRRGAQPLAREGRALRDPALSARRSRWTRVRLEPGGGRPIGGDGGAQGGQVRHDFRPGTTLDSIAAGG